MIEPQFLLSALGPCQKWIIDQAIHKESQQEPQPTQLLEQLRQHLEVVLKEVTLDIIIAVDITANHSEHLVMLSEVQPRWKNKKDSKCKRNQKSLGLADCVS